MSEVHYIGTLCLIEAIHHVEFTVEYLKLIKNGKAVRQKLNGFIDCVCDPGLLRDKDIADFISFIDIQGSNKWLVFKNADHLYIKQKVTGFMVRTTCSQDFCKKITNNQLRQFDCTSSMVKLKTILQEIFKPVICVAVVSRKSRCCERIKAVANMSFEQFKLFRGNRIETSRKMRKFEIWTVKDSQVEVVIKKIKSERDSINNSVE